MIAHSNRSSCNCLGIYSLTRSTSSFQIVYLNGYPLQQEVETFPLVQDIVSIWKDALHQLYPPSHRTSLQYDHK